MCLRCASVVSIAAIERLTSTLIEQQLSGDGVMTRAR
jgi:hypothetical protein